MRDPPGATVNPLYHNNARHWMARERNRKKKSPSFPSKHVVTYPVMDISLRDVTKGNNIS